MKPLDWFLAHRIAVFPIQPGTKQPAVPKGTHWATWDDFERPRPVGPYGVVLGSLIVVDTDDQAGEAFVAASMPPTPFMVKTARGWHRYYRAEGSTPATIHRHGLAIEARRAGQYVVGPGSLHGDGVTVYTASDWTWCWTDVPILPPDFRWDDRAVAVQRAEYTPPVELVRGERHQELFRLVRHLKGLGNTIDTARFTLKLYMDNRCTPPMVWDAAFESWYRRAFTLPDRPLPPMFEGDKL